VREGRRGGGRRGRERKQAKTKKGGRRRERKQAKMKNFFGLDRSRAVRWIVAESETSDVNQMTE
jgi:hypothetical protein